MFEDYVNGRLEIERVEAAERARCVRLLTGPDQADTLTKVSYRSELVAIGSDGLELRRSIVEQFASYRTRSMMT